MRMTDERLAEIDSALIAEHGRMFYAAVADELLQALKAEREILEGVVQNLTGRDKYIAELEARLDAVEDLVGYWRQRYHDALLSGDMQLEEYARYMDCADDLEKALEQK